MKRREHELLDRPLPRDLRAEQSVLGSVLLDPKVLIDVKSVVTAEDFFTEAHQEIYSAMLAMDAVDSLLLAAKLRAAGKLASVGGMAYLAEIVEVTPVAYHAVHYARIVAECARKRRLIELCMKAMKVLYGERHTAAEVAGRMKTAIERFRY